MKVQWSVLFLGCGAYALGLYLRGCLCLGSPLKQMPTREVLSVRCLRGMPRVYVSLDGQADFKTRTLRQMYWRKMWTNQK